MEKAKSQNTDELLTALNDKSEITIIDEYTSATVNKLMRTKMRKIDIVKKKKAAKAKRSLGNYLVTK